MPRRPFTATFASFAVALVAFAVPAGAQDAVRAAPENQAQVQLSFAPVVRQTAPAVVNVYAQRVVRTQAMPSIFDYFFGGRLAPQMGERVERSLGSGVIVDSSGIIVTNNHVVSGAQELRIVLNDRREFDAELVLADPRTDLAVLRVNASGLPALDYGRSSDLEVGDLVLAIGNPFGVGQSVSSGIVSALARTDVGITDYSFFIQTDAAVNPGNSGGALVDLRGRLVGVNTAIFSRTGDNTGIGFAIPSELVQRVVESAVEGAETVIRPWLGARVQPVTPELAASMGLELPQGALVSEVHADGPAERAGLSVGDVITRVDGLAVNDLNGVRFVLATHRIGATVPATVLRDGQPREIRLPVTAPPETPARDERRIAGRNPLQGATIANLSPAFADEIGLDPLETGVIITDVARGSAAAYFGLRAGDKLIQLGDDRIQSSSQTDDLLRENEGSASWPLAIQRGEQVYREVFRL